MHRPLLAAVLLAALAAPAQASPQLANRCVTLTPADGPPREALFLEPTGLGTYLLGQRDGRFVAPGGSTAEPGPAAEWSARGSRRTGWRITSTADGSPLDGRAGRWTATRATGCRAFPEAEVGATGRPFRGRLPDGTVAGIADAHVHVVADLRAGGRVIHGKAFDPFGIAKALGGDADDHGPQGVLDITGNLLRTGSPVGTHDTDGWPTFRGWPKHDTNTHQQVYWRWLQRMWRAGLRVAVAQVVEDEPLCEIEPLKSHSCDETETIELGVERLRQLERYVDAQHGGRGRGWLRLVDSPARARRVAERGKLAVVVGVESSNPFGCSQFRGEPQCTKADIDRGITRFRALGISSLFLAHWVDNALGGAALEGGDKGTFISLFQVEQTGTFFATGPCPEAGQGEEPPVALPAEVASALSPLAGNAPVYPEGKQCNVKGLTDLGRYAVERLLDAGFLIEADHLSERARLELLDIAERRGKPVVSSHTDTGGPWSESTLRRHLALDGLATATPAASADLPAKVARFARLGASAVGLGTDTGGFATLPGPEPGALSYPFTLNGTVFERQRSGERTFDHGADGVAHYGLFADHLAAMASKPGGEAAADLLMRSAEAYLRMWERTRR